MKVGDISNAFLMASCAEKIRSKAGPEFRDKEGAILTLKGGTVWSKDGIQILSQRFWRLSKKNGINFYKCRLRFMD